MKKLSDKVRKTLDAVRSAAAVHPLLAFTLDPEPSPAAGGWCIGRRRDGAPLIVTPARSAMISDRGQHMRFYVWLRRELAAAREAAQALSEEQLLALVGAPATAGELSARLTGGRLADPLSEEELLELLGANVDRDLHLDDPPRLEDWLPEGVGPGQVLSWRPIWSDETSTLFLTEEGFAWLQGEELERLDLREAALRVLARPQRELLISTTAALEREVPEPWRWDGVIGFCLLVSLLASPVCLVGGVIIAAVVAVAGFALSTAGVAIPDPPSVEWLIGALATGLLALVNGYVVHVAAQD